AEPYNYSAKHRVLPAPPGQGSVSGGQKNQMVQVRAFQAQWPVVVGLPSIPKALKSTPAPGLHIFGRNGIRTATGQGGEPISGSVPISKEFIWIMSSPAKLYLTL